MDGFQSVEVKMENIANPYRRNAFLCLFIIVLGIVLILLPGIIGMDGFNGGFALSFFGGFIVIVGIITVIFVFRLAAVFDTILKKENVLVHWTYTQEDWRQYTEEEHQDDKTDKKRLFLLVAGIAVVVGVIMCLMFPDDILLNIYIILGIIAMIGITAFLSQLSAYRWNQKRLGDVYISRDGAYLNRRLHIWKGLTTKLEAVSYEADEKSLPRLIFEYTSQNFLNRNHYSARIPVPHGQEQAAQKIAAQVEALHLGKKQQ